MGIMESGARGCEVVVSGKLRGQRAKSMKFVDGLMIHSGDPVNDYVDTAVRHVMLRQGVLGIKVKIMLPYDANGKQGPKKHLPDAITFVDPKEEEIPTQPYSEQKGTKPTDTRPPPGGPVAGGPAPAMGGPPNLGAGPVLGAGPPNLGAGPSLGAGPPVGQPGPPMA